MNTEIIIKARDTIQYLKLKAEGYKTAWVGEGKICLVKHTPNIRPCDCEEWPRCEHQRALNDKWRPVVGHDPSRAERLD